MELTEKQTRLLEFVKDMHQNHPTAPENAYRKYTNEEYWTHPLAVAEIVSEFEPAGIEMALCHDLFEDTDADFKMLYDELLRIGYDEVKAIKIGIGVNKLTNVYRTQHYPMLNRKSRKLKEAERLSTISPVAQSVKYSDIIHNASSVSQKDKSIGKLYLNEAIHILDGMRNGNINLLIKCASTIQDGLEDLEN